MKVNLGGWSVALFAAAMWFFAAQSYAQGDLQPVPVAPGFLADVADLLPPGEEDRISGLLGKISREKGSQLGVVIVKTTEPESIEDFAQRVFTAWKLGRKGVDDGVLLVLAPDNRVHRMRIHVGYGLEGSIPDAIAKRILAEKMRPALDSGNPALAVSIGVEALLAQMYKADIAAKPQIETIHLSEALIRLLAGTLAQVLLFTVAVYLLRKRFGFRVKLVGGLVFGMVGCALYAWVASVWMAPLALVWLVIPLLILVKNRDRISETEWRKPSSGSVPSGTRGLSRRSLQYLQIAAAVAAVSVAVSADVFSGGLLSIFFGGIWLVFSMTFANVLTSLDPAGPDMIGRYRTFWNTRGSSSGGGGSGGSGGGGGGGSGGSSGGGGASD